MDEYKVPSPCHPNRNHLHYQALLSQTCRQPTRLGPKNQFRHPQSRSSGLSAARYAVQSTLIGSIPIVGDLFDFLYKSNTKNLQIYQESLAGRRESAKDWMTVGLFVVAMRILLAIPIAIAVLLLTRILRG